jgi:hypothetical protein
VLCVMSHPLVFCWCFADVFAGVLLNPRAVRSEARKSQDLQRERLDRAGTRLADTAISVSHSVQLNHVAVAGACEGDPTSSSYTPPFPVLPSFSLC